MTDITLGQFIPGNSCIHRLDPRTKIVLMLVYIVMVFLVKSLPLFLVPLIYVFLCLGLGQISFSYFGKAIKPIRFLLVLMFLLNLFITPGEKVLFSWKFITVTEEGLLQAVFSHSDELSQMGLSLPAPCRVAALLRQKGVDAPADICTREDLEESLLRRMGA